MSDTLATPAVRRRLLIPAAAIVLVVAVGLAYLRLSDTDPSSESAAASGAQPAGSEAGEIEHPDFPFPKESLGFERVEDPGDATYVFRNPKGSYWEAVEAFNFYSKTLPKAGWEVVELRPDASAIGSILYHQDAKSYIAIDIVNQPAEVKGIELRMFLCPPLPRMTCGR